VPRMTQWRLLIKKPDVFRLKNLRIVDASTIASIVNGNLSGTAVMIAEKSADIILGNPPLPKSNAPVYKTPRKGQR